MYEVLLNTAKQRKPHSPKRTYFFNCKNFNSAINLSLIATFRKVIVLRTDVYGFAMLT